MITIINANTDLGVHVDGANLGPKLLTKGIKNKIINVDKKNIIKSKDKNDLKKNLNEVNNFTKEIFDKTLNILNSDDFPLLIGGDHSAVIGSALASQKYHNNIGIIWIDAHGDYNTFETTHSGNLHGLPLAAITGYKCNELTTLLNGFANSLEGNLHDAGVTIFTTYDIHNKGCKNVMDEAFKIALNNTNGVHISYDIDVIDPIIAPGVSVPEKDGINLEEANDIMDYLVSRKNNIKSMDLVEFNPAKDINNKTYNITFD